MKVKTSELSGAALDWAVAKADGWEPMMDEDGIYFYDFMEEKNWRPSTDWAQGGPIIEREGIALKRIIDGWRATRDWIRYDFIAPTPLIAAMRCYVASKLGDEVEVPNEILGE